MYAGTHTQLSAVVMKIMIYIGLGTDHTLAVSSRSECLTKNTFSVSLAEKGGIVYHQYMREEEKQEQRRKLTPYVEIRSHLAGPVCYMYTHKNYKQELAYLRD